MRYLLIPALLLSLAAAGQSLSFAPVHPSLAESTQPIELSDSPRYPHPRMLPLTVGSTVPDLLLANVFNSNTASLRLSSFRKKVLILDFWATWCASCLSGLQKLQALKGQYSTGFAVVLVNPKLSGDNRQKLAACYRTRAEKGQPIGFPSLIEDTILTALFPFKAVPHYVWLNSERKVLAITGSEELTAQNLEAAMAGRPLALPIKWERLDYSPAKPLSLFVDSATARYQSQLTAFLPGLPSGSVYVTPGSATTRFTYLNHSALALYRECVSLPANRWLVQVKDSAAFGASSKAVDHLYSYELSLPVSRVATRQILMLEDLNRYLPYEGRVQRQWRSVYVLRHTGADSLLQSAGGKQQFKVLPNGFLLKNAPLSKLVAALNGGVAAPVVLDETAYAGGVDLELSGSLKDLPALQTALSRYGLTMEKGDRDIEVFVVSDDVPIDKPVTAVSLINNSLR